MNMYIILYKHQNEGDKKHGPIRQYRIYANNLAEAQRTVEGYANYPNIEIIDIQPA